MGTYGRFPLSLGSGVGRLEFRVKIVSTVGDESWSSVVRPDEPRMPHSSASLWPQAPHRWARKDADLDAGSDTFVLEDASRV